MATRAAARSSRVGKKAEPAKLAAERIPAWLPLPVYAVVCLLLFREALLGGDSLLGIDSLALSYFARDFYTRFVTGLGGFPLWNPLLFGGMPFVDGMHGDIFYPPSLALFWMDARTMWAWKMALHIFLAGSFMFLWLRGLGLRRAPAFFGGLVYMMGAQLVSLTYPGGDGKLFVSALAPLVFWLAERAVRSGRVGDFAFFALGIAAIMFTSHMQLAYFCIWGVSAYFAFRVVQRWRAERSAGRVARLVGLYALAGLLGVGAAATQFFPPLDYLRNWSHRVDRTLEVQDPAEAYVYSTSFSLHPEELVSLVVPEFVGDNAATELRSGQTYWGRNGFKLNSEYAGLIPLLLVPVLLLRRRDPRTWFFVGLAGLSLLYALGATTPLFRLFYLIPGVRLFRAPSLIIFLYGLSVATLGAMGLQRLLDWLRESGAEDERQLARRALWGVAGGMGVLALLASLGVVTAIWQAVIYPGMGPAQQAALQQNLPNIRLGFWIAAALAAAVAGTWELAVRRIFGLRELLIVLCILAALDLYRAGRPFVRATVLINRVADPALFQPDESMAFLQSRRDAGEVFRAWDIGAYSQNVLAVNGIEQLAGHHGNEMGRYRTLIGGEQVLNAARSELRLLHLLNIEYIVSPGRLDEPELEQVFVGSRSVIYRNTEAMPRAYVVGRYEVVPSDRMVERLLAADFDREGMVLLETPPPAGLAFSPAAAGDAVWLERGVNESTLRVRADAPAMLVVSDNYYPAWRAEVDGVDTPILRANYTFRAVPIPAGEHTVRFVYSTENLRAPVAASAVLLLLLTGTGVAGELRNRRRRRGEPNSSAAGGPGSVD